MRRIHRCHSSYPDFQAIRTRAMSLSVAAFLAAPHEVPSVYVQAAIKRRRSPNECPVHVGRARAPAAASAGRAVGRSRARVICHGIMDQAGLGSRLFPLQCAICQSRGVPNAQDARCNQDVNRLIGIGWPHWRRNASSATWMGAAARGRPASIGCRETGEVCCSSAVERSTTALQRIAELAARGARPGERGEAVAARRERGRRHWPLTRQRVTTFG